MTGFSRLNGNLQTSNQNILWVWEIKSVNGKNFDIKTKLPFGYDDLTFLLKSKANEYIARGSVNAHLELTFENNCKQIKINDELLTLLTEKAIALTDRYGEDIAKPSAAELLSQKGVIEIEETTLNEEEQKVLKQNILQSFSQACASLQQERMKEGKKIKSALLNILKNIEKTILKIEHLAEDLPQKLKEKLQKQITEHLSNIEISEDRIAQEIILLITRADIQEEIDRLKTHIKSAYHLLESKEIIGRKLDFLCQELNREANTTCSKAADISITNLGVELKALIEQFREQVQNIE